MQNLWKSIFNKSTTIFPGLYFYRPQKWRQIVQNSSGTLQSYEHFNVTCKVHKSIDHAKWLSICFLKDHWHPCPFKLFGKSCAYQRKNELRHHHVISMRCARALIDHSSRPIDVQKNRSVIVKTGFQLHSFVRLKILKCCNRS